MSKYRTSIHKILILLIVCSTNATYTNADEKNKLVIFPPTANKVNSSLLRWSEIQAFTYSYIEQALVSSKNLSVLDRRSLDKTLSELKLAYTELADPNEREKVGKLLVADWILLTHFDEYRVSRTQRRLVFGGTLVDERKVRAKIKLRLIDASTQELLISDQFVVQLSKNASDRSAQNEVAATDEVVLHEVGRRISEKIHFELFDIPENPVPAIFLKTNESKKNSPEKIREKNTQEDNDW